MHYTAEYTNQQDRKGWGQHLQENERIPWDGGERSHAVDRMGAWGVHDELRRWQLLRGLGSLAALPDPRCMAEGMVAPRQP